jgi:hypothetical protein
MTRYVIGYSQRRDLRRALDLAREELDVQGWMPAFVAGSIERLHAGEGTTVDVLVCAQTYALAGEPSSAEQLIRGTFGVE